MSDVKTLSQFKIWFAGYSEDRDFETLGLKPHEWLKIKEKLESIEENVVVTNKQNYRTSPIMMGDAEPLQDQKATVKNAFDSIKSEMGVK